MPRLQRRNFDNPEHVRTFTHGWIRLVSLDEMTLGFLHFDPGWRWSNDIKPIAGTETCKVRHVGHVISGQLHVEADDGSSLDILPGDAYEIPPGHDAWVVGNEPFVTFEFASSRTFAAAPVDLGESILATLLFTDIVGSTA